MKHKIQVVMLPTNDISNIHQQLEGNLSYREIKRLAHKFTDTFHLYITVDQSIEPIKESDWYLEAIMGSYMIHQMNAKSLEGWNSTEDKLDNFKRRCRKVIATTDPNLHNILGDKLICEDTNTYEPIYEQVPQVQQSFIEEYVANPNREWEVEYELFSVHIGSKLKLNQDNTVILTSVGEKMYSREEVATLIRRCFAGVEGKYTIEEPLKINDWIKENL